MIQKIAMWLPQQSHAKPKLLSLSIYAISHAQHLAHLASKPKAQTRFLPTCSLLTHSKYSRSSNNKHKTMLSRL